MTGRDEEVPFTVSVNFDLTPRPGVALRAHGADVSIRRATVPDSLPCADARGPAWEHAGGSRADPPPGRRAIIALYDALYRKCQTLAIVGRRRLFEWLPTVAARHVRVSIFHRTRSEQWFGQGVAHLAAALTEATVGTP